MSLRSPSPPLPTFGIRALPGPSDPPWLISISKRQYDSTIKSQPDSKLLYLDDDDGELITVGSSFELSQRLDDPVPQYKGGGFSRTLNPLDGKLVHVFDIKYSSGSLAEWRDHEAYSSKNLRPNTPERQRCGSITGLDKFPWKDYTPSLLDEPSASRSPPDTESISPIPTIKGKERETQPASVAQVNESKVSQPETTPGKSINLIGGIEEHLNGLASVLQMAANTLQKAANKTRDTDTSLVEDILKGVKDILTEVGHFGVEALKELNRDTDEDPNAASRTQHEQSLYTCPEQDVPTVSDCKARDGIEESLTDIYSRLAREAKNEYELRRQDVTVAEPSLPPSKPPSFVSDDVSIKSGTRVKFAFVEDEKADAVDSAIDSKFSNSVIVDDDLPSEAEVPTGFDLIDDHPTKKPTTSSILDDSLEDADFTARYPPLSSVRRARSCLDNGPAYVSISRPLFRNSIDAYTTQDDVTARLEASCIVADNTPASEEANAQDDMDFEDAILNLTPNQYDKAGDRIVPFSRPPTWESLKPELEDLWFNRRWTPQRIKEYLQHECDFEVTTRDVKTKFQSWGWDKQVATTRRAARLATSTIPGLFTSSTAIENRKEDNLGSNDVVHKPVPGAWPEAKNEATSTLPTSGESSGAFFNRMIGRQRSTESSNFGLQRANTTASSNPASRLNGPFDPGFPYSVPASAASHRRDLPYRLHRRSGSPFRTLSERISARSSRAAGDAPMLETKRSVPNFARSIRRDPVTLKNSSSTSTATSNVPGLSKFESHKAVKHHRSVPHFQPYAPPTPPGLQSCWAPRNPAPRPRASFFKGYAPPPDYLTGASAQPASPLMSYPAVLPEPSLTAAASSRAPCQTQSYNPETDTARSSYPSPMAPLPLARSTCTKASGSVVSGVWTEKPNWDNEAQCFTGRPAKSETIFFPPPPPVKSHVPAKSISSTSSSPDSPAYWRLDPESGAVSPPYVPTSPTTPANLPAKSKSKYDICVEQLQMCGFGIDDDNMKDRLHVYAVAADGNVEEAVEMIEEDRRVSCRFE